MKTQQVKIFFSILQVVFKEDEPYGASGCVADCDNKVGVQLRVGEGVYTVRPDAKHLLE